jgi:hypothetical protein
VLVKEGTTVGGFCREGALSNRKEFDLASGSEILKRFELVCVWLIWSDFSWHPWGFLASILFIFSAGVNLLKEGELGV